MVLNKIRFYIYTSKVGVAEILRESGIGWGFSLNELILGGTDIKSLIKKRVFVPSNPSSALSWETAYQLTASLGLIQETRESATCMPSGLERC